MNPQELRLEHIAPYLPYGLKFELLDYKCDYVGEKYGICNGFYFIGDGVYYTFKSRDTAGKNFNSCKPILRPLSDITKDDNIDLYESLSYNSKMFVLRTDLKQHDWVKAIRYDDFTNLLKNHFDMFNLIEKGLAIDFNQLKLTDN